MTKNKKRLFVLSILIFAVIFAFIAFKSIYKLTYSEFRTFGNTTANKNIVLSGLDQNITQEFEMPYDMLQGISIKVGHIDRDANFAGEFSIVDCSNNKVIYKDSVNINSASDNNYHFIKLKNKVKLNKKNKYRLEICAKEDKTNTGLNFAISDGSCQEGSELHHNGNAINGSLCFKVHGGDFDFWWLGFTIFLGFCMALILIRVGYLLKRNVSIKGDKIFQGMMVFAVTFLLFSMFGAAERVCDEMDNMYGGMVIANGGVLYRDYVTQHTPLTYYICSIFALLGAGSAEQFRLSFYIMEAIVWALIYLRHSSNFGKKNMFMLPIMELVFVASLNLAGGVANAQILSDKIWAVCTVVLMLEFLRYIKDKDLRWDRCIIVSICGWGCFGVAFISAYAIMWFVLVFIVCEFKYWLKIGVSLKSLVKRYYKLLISIFVPLICAIFYFKVNNALGEAYRQAYLFNREVYPRYTGGFGAKLTEPFVIAIKSLVKLLESNFNDIITAKSTGVVLLSFCIIIASIFNLIVIWKKKKYMQVMILALVMIFSATRDYGFHGMAAWYVAVLIIALYFDCILEYLPKKSLPLAGIMLFVLLIPFVQMAGHSLIHRQESISEIESEVISLTENDENKNIYLDVWSSGSLYYFYKNRYPVNKAVFMLPWYMEWYEQDNIDSLNKKLPRVVVYNENESAWGHSNYAKSFASELKKNYERISNNPKDDWKYIVWVRK